MMLLLYLGAFLSGLVCGCLVCLLYAMASLRHVKEDLR